MTIAASFALVLLAPSSSGAASPAPDRGQPEVAAVPWNLAEPESDEPSARTKATVSKTALAPVEPPPQPAPVLTGSPLRPRRELERMSPKPIGAGKIQYK